MRVLLALLFCLNLVTAETKNYTSNTVQEDVFCMQPSGTAYRFILQNQERVYNKKDICLEVRKISGLVHRECNKNKIDFTLTLQEEYIYYHVSVYAKNPEDTQEYELSVTGTGFYLGECPSTALAKGLGMQGEDVNFVLALSGLSVALIFNLAVLFGISSISSKMEF